MNKALVSSSFRVGRYWCDMAIDADGQMSAEWRPHFPDVAGDLIREYRAGRDDLVQEWARLTGIPVAIVETCSAQVPEA